MPLLSKLLCRQRWASMSMQSPATGSHSGGDVSAASSEGGLEGLRSSTGPAVDSALGCEMLVVLSLGHRWRGSNQDPCRYCIGHLR